MKIAGGAMIALIVAGIFPAASIYAWQTYHKPEAERLAVDLCFDALKDTSTFKFDGRLSSVQLLSAVEHDGEWAVKVGYESTHPGYGDRAWQKLLQAVTPHVVDFTVADGKVIGAVVDGVYDELKPLNDPEYPDAVRVATGWLKAAPTFAFDGMGQSLRVEKVAPLRILGGYAVTVSFESRHAGYGDRTGRFIAQVITPHTAEMRLIGELVTSCVLDGAWDEIKQVGLRVPDKPESSARDAALASIVERYNLSIALPNDWTVADVSTGVLGSQILMYVSGDWKVTVEYPVVLKHAYTVSVTYGGSEGAFSWEGEVVNGDVEEIETTLVARFLTPEEARDAAVKFAILSASASLTAPFEWIEADLTRPGLVGSSTRAYTGSGWKVTVTWPVVWKPHYSVDVTYDGTEKIAMCLTVTQDGQVSKASNK